MDFITLFQFNITKTFMDYCFQLHGFIVSIPVNLATINITGMYYHIPIISKFNLSDLQSVTFKYFGTHPYEKQFLNVISNNILKIEDTEKLFSDIINDFSEIKKKQNNTITSTTT